MRIKTLLISALTISALSLSAQQAKTQSQTKNTVLPRPKLVVGIMVDQMRMLNEGFSCENTYINYMPSVTGVGHATVYTGSVPAIHGIAGNDWIIQATGKTMYCSADSTVQTVGSSTEAAGKMSPLNLLSTSMTDELRLATNFRSKVIAIASKDRGSILPGGHTALHFLLKHQKCLTRGWVSSPVLLTEAL